MLVENIFLTMTNEAWRLRNSSPYKVLVTTHAMSFIAFKKVDSAERWMAERRLLTQGANGGMKASGARYSDPEMHSILPRLMRGSPCESSVIVGFFEKRMHMSYDKFFALDDGKNLVTRIMDNAKWTLCIITRDEDKGHAVENFLNCNCKHRPILDRAESEDGWG